MSAPPLKAPAWAPTWAPPSAPVQTGAPNAAANTHERAPCARTANRDNPGESL
jgi:hypothetical protein